MTALTEFPAATNQPQHAYVRRRWSSIPVPLICAPKVDTTTRSASSPSARRLRSRPLISHAVEPKAADHPDSGWICSDDRCIRRGRYFGVQSALRLWNGSGGCHVPGHIDISLSKTAVRQPQVGLCARRYRPRLEVQEGDGLTRCPLSPSKYATRAHRTEGIPASANCAGRVPPPQASDCENQIRASSAAR